MAKWNFEQAHSGASFSVRHMMIATVRGQFDRIEGSLEFDPANPQAGGYVEATLHAASISTGNEQRDGHLRSGDFLDAEHFPLLTFRSTKVEATGETSARIHGDLTIRGTTLPVVLEAEYLGLNTSPYGDQRVGFTATTKINREQFGLTWNMALEAGGVLVGKDVAITLDVEAVPAVQAEKA